VNPSTCGRAGPNRHTPRETTLTAPTLAPTVVCTPWCRQGDGHPGEIPGGASCLSDLPDDTLTTPSGELAAYLDRTDGHTTLRVDLTPLPGGCVTLTVDVAEARAWAAAVITACDLAGDSDTLNSGRPAVAS
jgi:hypothetical protein